MYQNLGAPKCRSVKRVSKATVFFKLKELLTIYAMQVHVLGVPGKCGLPTAKVEVGRVHSVDLDAIIFLNVIED